MESAPSLDIAARAEAFRNERKRANEENEREERRAAETRAASSERERANAALKVAEDERDRAHADAEVSKIKKVSAEAVSEEARTIFEFESNRMRDAERDATEARSALLTAENLAALACRRSGKAEAAALEATEKVNALRSVIAAADSAIAGVKARIKATGAE